MFQERKRGTFIFGKYRGLEMCDPTVSLEYLLWLRRSSQEMVEDIDQEIARREAAEEADLDWVERIVQVGFRELAKRCHPDHGGKTDEMRELNNANAKLKEIIAMGRQS